MGEGCLMASMYEGDGYTYLQSWRTSRSSSARFSSCVIESLSRPVCWNPLIYFEV